MVRVNVVTLEGGAASQRSVFVVAWLAGWLASRLAGSVNKVT